MYEREYQPPAEGSPESADPHFRARERPCSRCDELFVTSARWRMFCPFCRATNAVRFPTHERMCGLSGGRSSGGG